MLQKGLHLGALFYMPPHATKWYLTKDTHGVHLTKLSHLIDHIMPYRWTYNSDHSPAQLDLWAHNALAPRWLAITVLSTLFAISIPLFMVLGTIAFWGLLPFVIGTVGALWFGLERNQKQRSMYETMWFGDDNVTLRHTPVQGDPLEWDCNRYWAKVNIYENNGPLRDYVTLRGNGREVQIGAFLTDEERRALYGDLKRHLT